MTASIDVPLSFIAPLLCSRIGLSNAGPVEGWLTPGSWLMVREPKVFHVSLHLFFMRISSALVPASSLQK